jgi:uncharacterized protein YecE (DUF72 family)
VQLLPSLALDEETAGDFFAALRDRGDVPRWCMFDNTTLGAAAGNALDLARLLE